MSSVIAIVFAGGSGVRLGTGKPKQFIEVNGKPVIIYTLENFEDHPEVEAVYVACKDKYMDTFQKMISRYDLKKIKAVVPGGNTAMASAYNALKAAAEDYPEDTIALIHDGVRPCISKALINDVISTVNEKGTAVTCSPMYETPVLSTEGALVEDIPKRDTCFTAQAPQAFRLGEVLSAHEAARKKDPEYTGIVDNCTLMKLAGNDIAIVKGPRSNIKITTPEDLYIFKAMLEYKETIDALGL